ncbi:MAG: lipoyl(octanoyl) transferase LipB [Akkermansiaceae bacterium]
MPICPDSGLVSPSGCHYAGTMRLQQQWLGSGIDYHDGLKIQLSTVEDVLCKDHGNTLLCLEHAPVYTIGRTRDVSSLGPNTKLLPHPVIETNRGGQATYHGPGQLTGYPVVDLRPLGKDLHAYIRALEEALIETCRHYDVLASQRDGLTGVWVEDRKLASIGVGVKKWISMHGFAINITRQSLDGFASITPCGINDVTMTCLESEAGKKIGVREFAQQCHAHVETALERITI